MDATFTWKPNRLSYDRLMALSRWRGESPETIISEALSWYLEAVMLESVGPVRDDPLIGLFTGAPDLSIRSESILQQEISPYSGWTWKETQP